MVAYSEREWWIDYAKAICIFLVVFIHLLTSGYFKGITYSVNINVLTLGEVFYMLLFFFVSGYLYRDLNPKMALEKYFKRLIVPYFFFSFVGIFVIVLLNGYYKNINIFLHSMGRLLPSLFITGTYSNVIAANGPIWFLLALFTVIISFSLMKTYFKEYKYILIVILGFNAVLYTLNAWNIQVIYLAFNSAILGLMFFFVGYLSKKNDIMRFFKNNYINVIMLLVFFALTYLEFVYNGGLAFHRGNWKGNIILGYLGGFTGIIMVIAISSILSKFKFKAIYLVSISTLIIMSLNYPLQIILVPLTKKSLLLGGHNLLYITIMSIIIVSISVPIYIILNNHTPFLVGNKNKELKTGANIRYKSSVYITNAFRRIREY
jgi:fucose 4-O-acetylase-like acetyltransferase